MNEVTNGIDWMNPLLQYGFAGLCAILLVIMTWLIWNLIKLLEQTNTIIAQNTQAVVQVDQTTKECIKLLRSLHDKIISRPCIAKKERGQ